MKKSLVVLLALASFGVMAQQAAPSLEQVCLDRVRPTLKGVERIRDIGGDRQMNVTFAISANGGATRVVDCRVQKDGTLQLVDKGSIKKAS